MIVFRILALAAFVFFQGWVALPSIGGGKSSLDSMERLFLIFALGTGICSLLAFILVSMSSFSLVRFLTFAAMVDMALLILATRRPRVSCCFCKINAVTLLVVIIIGAILFSPPWRIVFGWSDVGVYASLAAHINREGGVSVDSRAAAAVSEENRELLFHRETKRTSGEFYFENQFFVVDDFESGTLRPWFYLLWPSLMAVFASFLGFSHMFWTVTVVSVLAFWGFFLFSRRMLKQRWAIFASLLMALNPLTLYFSRYTTSEMMNMMLFLAGALCLLAYTHSEDPSERKVMALLSAFFLFMGMLCRIDFIVIVVPVALCYMVKKLSGNFSAADLLFISSLSAGAVCAVLAGLLLSQTYFQSVWKSAINGIRSPFALIVIAAVAVFVIGLCASRRLKRLAREIVASRVAWISILWVMLAGAFIYLYFVRPCGKDGNIGYGFIRELRGPSYANQNLVRWGWYLSFPGLAAIFSGYGLWFTRRRGFGEHALGTVGLVYTFLYAWDMRAIPMHVLVMRRLVPVILPMAVIMIVCAIKWLKKTTDSRWVRKHSAIVRTAPVLAAAAVVLFLTLFSAYASVPIMGLDEGGNQIETVASIAADVDPGGLVLMDYNAGDLYGVPLRCIFCIDNAWLKDNGALADARASALFKDLGFPEIPLYLLWRPAASKGFVQLTGSLEAVKIGEYGFRESSLEKTFDKRPSRRVNISERFILYRILPGSG